MNVRDCLSLSHRVLIYCIPCEVTILGVPLQQALPPQKTADPVGEGIHELGKFLAGRRLDPAEPD